MSWTRDPGAARNGVGDWLAQRISALVLLLAAPWPLALLVAVARGALDQRALLALLDAPWVRVAHTVFALALVVHAWVGIKVIAQDYVHAIGWRMALLSAVGLAIAAATIWWLAVIWAWLG